MKAAGPEVLLHTNSLQAIPQYIEVPPHIEAKQIFLCFFPVLSYGSNRLLLKDESNPLPFSGCWQALCNNYLYDTGLPLPRKT